MKSYFYILFVTIIAIVFSACSKTTVDSSQISNRLSISTVTSGTSTRSGTTSFPAISFNIKDQLVRTALSNKTLIMNYNEDINLLARKDSLLGSWSIIFTEDFKGTQLAKFNYVTMSKAGNQTTNYVEPNLNNVVISAMKDTVMNGLAYTKISFNRIFSFTNTYSTSTEAGAQYDYLMKNKDVISFSAYVTSASGKSGVGSTKATLIYL